MSVVATWAGLHVGVIREPAIPLPAQTRCLSRLRCPVHQGNGIDEPGADRPEEPFHSPEQVASDAAIGRMIEAPF
jgi:hypothetical protein